MKREEAITIIDNLHLIGCGRNQHEDDLKINEALDMAIEALQDRPIGEWKPISDGPPQRVGSYLVTCKGEHGFIYTDYDFWTVTDEFKYNHDNVIAWVPFLEPYKESK